MYRVYCMSTFQVSKKPNVLNLRFKFCPPWKHLGGGAKKILRFAQILPPPRFISVYALAVSILISWCTIWSELYSVESFLCRNGPFIYLTISFSFKFNWLQFSMTSMTEPVSENLFIWNVVLWRPYCERMINDHYTYKTNYWFQMQVFSVCNRSRCYQ